jgi:hypothetical protein
MSDWSPQLRGAATARFGSRGEGAEAVRKLLCAVIWFVLLGCARTSHAMTLIEEGQVTARVILAENAGSVEASAAELLCEYLDAMAGLPAGSTRPIGEADWTVTSEATALLVGRSTSSPLIARLVDGGALQLQQPGKQTDEIVLRSVEDGGCDYLVVTGGSDRAVYYAAAHFLEQCGRVGLFWDGEYIPHRENWTLNDVDIAESPRFAVRQYMQYCPFLYNHMWFWDAEQTEQHLKWAAWKKQSRILWPEIYHYHFNHDKEYESFRREASPVFDGFIAEAMAGALVTGRERFGFEFVTTLIDEQQPVEPNPDHIYGYSFPSEDLVRHLSDEGKRDEFIRYVNEARAKIRALDGEGVWYAAGWGLCDPGMSPESARTVFSVVGDEPFYVSDMWADEGAVYEKYDYFHGHDWLFGIIHSFGGWNTLFGDLQQLVEQMKRVASDPRAANCIGTYINPEIIFYDPFYYELATRLAWRPGDVELSGFIRDYCERRYGEASAPAMAQAFDELVASVYGPTTHELSETWAEKEPSLPAWSYRMGAVEKGEYRRRQKFLPHLQRAVQLMLSQHDQQQGNKLYALDLTETALQLVRDTFNAHAQRCYAAFISADEARFEQSAEAMQRCLAAAEELMAARKEYWIRPILDHIEAYPGMSPQLRKDIEHFFKYWVYTFATHPFLRDYNRQDRFELMHSYYRPRVEAYLAYLRERFAAGEYIIDVRDLEPLYLAIEGRWMSEPLPSVADLPSVSTVAVAQRTLASMTELALPLDCSAGVERAWRLAESIKCIWAEGDESLVIAAAGMEDQSVSGRMVWHIADDSAWTITPSTCGFVSERGEDLRQRFAISLGHDLAGALPLPYCDVIIDTVPDPVVKRLQLPVTLLSRLQKTSAARTASPPVVDGSLEDDVWQRPADIAGFADATTHREASIPTEAWLAYDAENLYVAIRAYENKLSSLRTEKTGHDEQVWEDDSVELLIDGDFDRETLHQFIVTAGNATYDGKGLDKQWDGEWHRAVGREEECWVVELAIAWTTLEVDAPTPGSVIGLLLGRNRRLGAAEGDENLQWPMTIGGNHIADMYAPITLGE